MTQNEIKKLVNDAIDNNAELAEIKAKIADAVAKYNEANDAGDFKAKAKTDVELQELVSTYSGKAAILVFGTLAGVSDNLLPAILCYDYPVVVYKDDRETVELPEVGEVKVPIRKVDTKTKRIDLQKFDKYCEKNYGKHLSANPACWSMIDELNYYMTKRAASDLGAAMTAPYGFAKSTTLGNIKPKEVIGASNTQMLKTLQRVVDAVLYIEGENGNQYKALSHDVRYLDICATAKGKDRLSVKGAKTSDMNDTVGNIIYRIASGTPYSIAYKTEKQK